ncbi:MAG: hypothetical protein ACREFE_16820 [Limisphaerales bacterium]
MNPYIDFLLEKSSGNCSDFSVSLTLASASHDRRQYLRLPIPRRRHFTFTAAAPPTEK